MAKGNTPTPRAKATSGGSTSGSGSAQQIQQMTTVATAYATAYQKAIANGVGTSAAGHGAVLAASIAAGNTTLSQAQVNAAIAQGAQTAQAAQQQQQATQPQATSSPSNANYNYFTDTSKFPTNPKMSDVSTLTDAFLSKANIDKVANFIDNISATEMNMPKQSSQWIVSEAMGFNAKPRVHDHVKSLATNDPDRVIMYRGIFGNGQQGAQWADEYKNGSRFASKGYMGDGDYFQLSYSGAKYYATNPGVGAYSSGSGTNANVAGSIVTASFNPSKVKIIDKDTLYKLSTKIKSELEYKIKSYTASSAEKKVYALLSENTVTNKQGKSKTFTSGTKGAMGTLATMLGYDAIYAKNEGGSGNDYYAILNRGILDVKKGY